MSSARLRESMPTHPAPLPAAMMCRATGATAGAIDQVQAAPVWLPGVAPLYAWAYQAAVARVAAEELQRAGRAFVRAVASAN